VLISKLIQLLSAPPHGSGSAFLFGVPSSTAGKAHNEVLAELIDLAAFAVLFLVIFVATRSLNREMSLRGGSALLIVKK
jgi:hypothetical protein